MKCFIGEVGQLFDHPEFQSVLDEYTAECKIKCLPAPKPNRALYERMGEAGSLSVWIALDGAHLAGFAGVLHTATPHYDCAMDTVESLFVPKQYRRQGVGLELLRRIELQAKGTALFVSAPVGSPLEKVLRARKYAHTNQVFCKWQPRHP